MITCTWRQALDADEAWEVRELVAEAAEYDEEAGFSTVTPPGETRGHELLVRIQPGEGERVWPLAAYLRVDVDEGVGAVQFVVRPRFRSLGVATSVFEKIGLPGSSAGNWCGTSARELRIWAHGDHPAAHRMARRFGARPVSRMWALVRRLDAAAEWPSGPLTVRAATAAEAARVAGIEAGATGLVSPAGWEHLLPGSVALVAVGESGEPRGVVRLSGPAANGSPGTATGVVLTLAVAGSGDRGVVRALLGAGLDHLRRGGAGKVELYLDSGNRTGVAVAREFSFEHDRSDVCYLV
ncbi:hypothetical protein [Amycolatopsis methanolica]|uniref:Acetyltransferase n=1 Tax=Amycolatopsis methanolica 239 TaxID=1068978 RepID=A0A076MW52_AMYME|nr:hypothetical protein [Amycolatopsis methanolica]AIJ23291.1 acetyltransferase [Amycolatopsis methanolica 239]